MRHLVTLYTQSGSRKTDAYSQLAHSFSYFHSFQDSNPQVSAAHIYGIPSLLCSTSLETRPQTHQRVCLPGDSKPVKSMIKYQNLTVSDSLLFTGSSCLFSLQSSSLCPLIPNFCSQIFLSHIQGINQEGGFPFKPAHPPCLRRKFHKLNAVLPTTET